MKPLYVTNTLGPNDFDVVLFQRLVEVERGDLRYCPLYREVKFIISFTSFKLYIST